MPSMVVIFARSGTFFISWIFNCNAPENSSTVPFTEIQSSDPSGDTASSLVSHIFASMIPERSCSSRLTNGLPALVFRSETERT